MEKKLKFHASTEIISLFWSQCNLALIALKSMEGVEWQFQGQGLERFEFEGWKLLHRKEGKRWKNCQCLVVKRGDTGNLKLTAMSLKLTSQRFLIFEFEF